MRKIFTPVVPAASCCAAMAAVLIIAIPVVKVTVEAIFGAFGY